MVSIRPRYASALAAGMKTVELRRRFPDVAPGALLAVYTIPPVGALTAIGGIDRVDRQPPGARWELHQARVGISRQEFDDEVARMRSP